MMLGRLILSALILVVSLGPIDAHVHKTNGVTYDYTKSDAKDCCNNSDCRPAQKHYVDGTFHFFYVEPNSYERTKGYPARWVKIARESVRFIDLFGDGSSHWCGNLYLEGFGTYCAFVPPKREMTKSPAEYFDSTLIHPGEARGAFF